MREKIIQALYLASLLLLLAPALLSRIEDLPHTAVWLPTVLAVALFFAARVLARRK